MSKSYELKTSQFSDPDQKSGQHTNGPANVFVREDDGCSWYVVTERMSEHKARKLIAEIGISKFQAQYCAKVE